MTNQRPTESRPIWPILATALAINLLVMLGGTGPTGATIDTAGEPEVDVLRAIEVGPIDAVPSLSVVVQGAEACDGPLDPVTGYDDPGRGVSVTIDGTEAYRTGADNIQLEFDGEVTRSYIRYAGPGSFFVAAAGFDPAGGTVGIEVGCRDEAGRWATVFDRTVPVLGEQAASFIAGIDSTSGRLLIGDYRYNYLGLPEVLLDGRPIEIGSGDHEGFYVASLPDDLAPGLHWITMRADGLEVVSPAVHTTGLTEAVAYRPPPEAASPPGPGAGDTTGNDTDPAQEADQAQDTDHDGRPTADQPAESGEEQPAESAQAPTPAGPATEPADASSDDAERTNNAATADDTVDTSEVAAAPLDESPMLSEPAAPIGLIVGVAGVILAVGVAAALALGRAGSFRATRRLRRAK